MQSAPVVRFGAFELDVRAGELRKHGLKIKLQEQPFQILVMLLEQPGVVVTREQLHQKLWPDGTFVDFEHGLNAAMQRVRQALNDSAENPRFVATIPRKGYRFIASVEGAAVPTTVAPQAGRRWLIWATVLGALVIAGAGLWLLRTNRSAEPAPTTVPLTRYPGAEISPSLSPDGNYVAFAWWDEKKAQSGFDIFVKLVNGGGDPVRLTHDPASDSFSPAWSPDGRLIAFLRDSSEFTSGVFLVPPVGGAERKVAEIYLPRSPWFGNLSWFPDGKWLAVGDRQTPDGPSAVFRMSADTGEKQRLTTPPQHSLGDTNPAVSPDGRALVFVRSGDLFLLELSRSLSPVGEPRRLTSDMSVQAAAWMPDGRAVVFSAGSNHTPSLWRLAIPPPRWRSRGPERLQFAGEGAREPSISRQGRLVYDQWFVDVDIWRLQLNGRRAKKEAPVRLISSTRVDHEPRYSPNGKRIAFGSDRSGSMEIWVADSDGSNAVQLTSFGRFFYCGGPHWSPDGRSIAFFAKLGEDKTAHYLVSADGGTPRLLPVDLSDWSRDGKWIYFGSTRSGKRQLWKMPWPPSGQEREAVQITKNGFGGDPALESFDGRFVYYLKGIAESVYEGANTLWKVPTEGGDEAQVLGSVANNNFMIVGKGIYFVPAVEQPLIQFINFADGKVITIARPLHYPAWGLSVSPDGQQLLYSEFEERQSDLMLVENFQ